MKNLFFLLLIFFLGLSAHAQDAAPAHVIHEVHSKVFEDLKEVVLRIEMKKPTSESCTNWKWGAYRQCPDLMMTDFSLKVGQRDIYIPRSAYTDLGGHVSVELLSKKSLIFVLIKNGDEEGRGYLAELKFSEKFIQERSVSGFDSSSSFKGEKTVYSYKEYEEPLTVK